MNSSSACAVPSAIRRSRLASASAGVSLVLCQRRGPLEADACGREIAACGEIDRLARDRLGVGLQQALHEDRRPVERPARPAGRISAFAFLKLHDLSPCSAAKKIRRARALRVRATKSPARCPARASRRSFGEYAFLEDSRYASQEKNACGKRGATKGSRMDRPCPEG